MSLFHSAKKRWNVFSKTTVRSQALFSSTAIQGVCSQYLLESLQKRPSLCMKSQSSETAQQHLHSTHMQPWLPAGTWGRGLGPQICQTKAGHSSAWKRRYISSGHFQCSQGEKRNWMIMSQSRFFFFFLYFLKVLRPVVIHSFSVYPSLARSLENDKMGDRRHQEQQNVQSLCDYSSQSQSAMAKLPAQAWLPHVLGRVLWTLHWRGAGYRTFSQQQCAGVPHPLGQIMTELKQEWRC